jgi:NADH-quinone oxidoreductase subunit K
LAFTLFLFCLSSIGILFNKQTFLHVLFNIEIMFLSVSLTYIGFAIFYFDVKGQIYALVILAATAAESCVGLALLVTLLRVKHNIRLQDLNF